MARDYQKLGADRLQRVLKVINLEEPDRVPIMGNVGAWVLEDKSINDKAVMFNYELIDTIAKKFLTDFDFDCACLQVTRSGPAFQALGQGRGGYVLSPNHKSLQYIDTPFMQEDEYDHLIKDPFAFIFNTILPRKFSALEQEGQAKTLALAKSTMLYQEYQAALSLYVADWSANYGMVALTRGGTRVPLDLIADYLRGFRGLLLDLKNHSQKIAEACEALLPLMIKWAQIQLQTKQKLPMVFLPLHIPTYLGPLYFEKLYLPSLKSMVEAITDCGSGCYIFFEGNWNPYLEYLTDLPVRHGQVIGHFETVDMKRAKAVLGKKLCIAGNFPSELLNFGSDAEIQNQAKLLLDEMAPGGGYIFAANMGMVDAKPGRVKTLIDYVQQYGRY